MKRLVLIFTLFGASPAVIADADKGKKLHAKYCTKCHGSEVYTRKDSFVNSREALYKQVKRCQLNVGAQWLDKDIDNVADYLDQSFYRFAK